MEFKKTIKQAKNWNTVLIAGTIGAWLCINIANMAIASRNISTGATIYYAGGVIYTILAIIALVFSIKIQKELNQHNIKGGSLLIASAIAALVTGITILVVGFMIGLIVFILSGISIKQLTDSGKIVEFEKNLATENTNTTTEV